MLAHKLPQHANIVALMFQEVKTVHAPKSELQEVVIQTLFAHAHLLGGVLEAPGAGEIGRFVAELGLGRAGTHAKDVVERLLLLHVSAGGSSGLARRPARCGNKKIHT